MFTSLTAAKAGARRLQSAFKKAARPQKLTICQRIIARSCGYEDWLALAKAIGTPHAPKRATDSELVMKAFGKEAAKELPRGSAIDVGALFAETFSHGIGESNLDPKRLSDAVRTAPGFFDLADAYRNSVPTDFESKSIRQHTLEIAALKAGRITLDVGLDSETCDSHLPIREVTAALWDKKKVVGFIDGLLLVPRRRGTVSLDYAVDIGDHKADHYVWSILNFGKAMGETAFDAGVMFLWHWQLAPGYRGKQIGTAFLAAVMKNLKKSHPLLETIAINSASPSALDFTKEADGAALEVASVRKLRAYLETIDCSCLGRNGRVVLYDNARQGGHYETILAMGGLAAIGEDVTDELRGEEDLQRLAAQFIEEGGPLSHMVARQQSMKSKPKPLKDVEFPQDYSPFGLIAAGFKPHPLLMHHMPREVVFIKVIFYPPDIEFRTPSAHPRLRLIALDFQNGTRLYIQPRELAPPIDPDIIAELNETHPKAEYAPDWALGELYEVLLTNLHLLFSIDPVADYPVACGADITLDPRLGPPSCGTEIGFWPDGVDGRAFIAMVEEHFAGGADRRSKAMAAFASDVLRDGHMEREMYSQEIEGEQYIRQRFHKRPWTEPNGLTFGSLFDKTSPTTPYGNCPAHESYLVRYCAMLASFITPSVEHALKHHPAVAALLQTHFVDLESAARPVEAAPFLPGLWPWWRQAHDRLYKEWKDVRLAELANPPRKAMG